jgi:hypothetical protein
MPPTLLHVATSSSAIVGPTDSVANCRLKFVAARALSALNMALIQLVLNRLATSLHVVNAFLEQLQLAWFITLSSLAARFATLQAAWLDLMVLCVLKPRLCYAAHDVDNSWCICTQQGKSRA